MTNWFLLVFCLTPPVIEHARHSALPEQATFELDSTVQYHCYTGYVTAGFPRAKCLAIDGQAKFYGPDIHCEPRTCGEYTLRFLNRANLIPFFLELTRSTTGSGSRLACRRMLYVRVSHHLSLWWGLWIGWKIWTFLSSNWWLVTKRDANMCA